MCASAPTLLPGVDIVMAQSPFAAASRKDVASHECRRAAVTRPCLGEQSLWRMAPVTRLEPLSTAIADLMNRAAAAFDHDPVVARRLLFRAVSAPRAAREGHESVVHPTAPSAATGTLASWQVERAVAFIEANIAETLGAAKPAWGKLLTPGSGCTRVPRVSLSFARNFRVIGLSHRAYCASPRRRAFIRSSGAKNFRAKASNSPSLG
jgi:hypothetical protein